MTAKRLIFATTAVLYAALLGVAWVIGTRQAERKTEAMLDYAVNDIRTTIDGVIDTMLEHLASSAVRHFGKAAGHAPSEVSAVAAAFDVDEVNVVDRSGRIIATNDPDCLGVDMNAKDETRPFAELTNGVTRVVSQPFRRHAYGTSRRKYLGVPFPGGDGYVQVGLDETRMKKMISAQMAFLFDARMEETTCYLCADAETGALVSAQLGDGMAKTLDEIGFDVSRIPESGTRLPDVGGGEADETYEQTLHGRRAFCRSFMFAGHHFIMIEPKDEFYGTRNMIAMAMAVLLAIVLGGFALFLVRISSDSARLKAFYDAEDASRAKEMDIAKTIQMSALSGDVPPNEHFRYSASMTPARDVGGDFYDLFPLDSGRVAFLVADVSGKGVTAALYMMTAKTLIKDTLLAERDLASAITKVNADLSRSNPANMFLTAWIGVLDFESGRVDFVNAGHNPPVVRRTDGSASWLDEKSGPVLAFMEGAKYVVHSATLAPGDSLLLYTDGVTEAMDAKHELFGERRLMEALAVAPSGEPDRLCMLVRAVVAAFVAGAPAADDLTVLSVQYVSRPKRFVRSFSATQAGISDASDFLDEAVGSAGGEGPLAAAPALHVILDEIASNIVRHSGASGFEVDVEFTRDGAKLEFIDDGKPYDPLAHADPDTSLSAGERPIGGLGIFMVKKMASSVFYRRDRSRNFLLVFVGGGQNMV